MKIRACVSYQCARKPHFSQCRPRYIQAACVDSIGLVQYGDVPFRRIYVLLGGILPKGALSVGFAG